MKRLFSGRDKTKELIVFIFKLPLEWRTRNIKGQAKFFYTLLVFFWLL